MRKFLLGSIALAALITGPAMAADLRVKAPVYKAPPPIVVYNWTGWYVGGNIGYSWGRANTDFGVTGINALQGSSDTVRPNGVIGGGQLGYIFQFDPHWALGIEADIQASGERASNTFPFSAVAFNGGNTTVTVIDTNSYEAKIAWFGTVRGRLGYVWDRVLLYTTGGLAYGDVKLAGTANFVNNVCIAGGGCTANPGVGPIAFAGSNTKVGVAVGGGIETAFAGNWTAKIEYLYLDLGSIDTLSRDPNSTVVTTTHTRFTDNVVRVGINYRFGLGPVVANY